MAKCVQLPFKEPRFFSTTQGFAATEIAMTEHPTAYRQVLNQVTSLYCTRRFLKGFTTPQTSVPNILNQSFQLFERYVLNLRYVRNFCTEIIESAIDDGMYVYYEGVDDFYLPEKSWYGTRHFNHDGVICGYDDNDGTLSIATYDINWVFRLIRVPQECFVEGLKSAINNKCYGYMVAYKVRDNTNVKVNEKEMLKFLKEYFDSSFEKYPTDKDGEVRGIVVHDYLAMYIDKLKDGSIPYEKMDWRALRPVWEHKKCMLERIRAVENKNGWGNALSERYAPVVEKANRIRMMYAMYHKNHNDKLLDKIHDGLLDLARSDKELVGEFISKLEECVK